MDKAEEVCREYKVEEGPDGLRFVATCPNLRYNGQPTGAVGHNYVDALNELRRLCKMFCSKVGK